MAIDYGKLAAGKYTDKPPWYDFDGDCIVIIESDSVRDDRETPDVNYCSMRVIKVLEGPDNVQGKVFSRRRPCIKDGTAGEMKNRYTVALSLYERLRKGGDKNFVFPDANYTSATIKAIHDGGGDTIRGYPIRVHSKQGPMKTKPSQLFTVLTYHIPTARDLEGIKINDDGQVVVE